MRPTREGRHAPFRPGLIFRGIGTDPDVITEEPEPPTDRLDESAVAYVPFLPPDAVGETTDLNLQLGTCSDGGGIRAVVDPTFANDGSVSTHASRLSFVNPSGTKTWWLHSDLGSALQIDEVVILGGWGNSGENDPSWEIQYSDDNAAWTTATGSYVWDDTTNPNTATLTLTASETHRYWRVGQTITFAGFIYPLKIHTWQLNGPQMIAPTEIIWVEAPLSIDGDDATEEFVSNDSATAAASIIWRATLPDSYLIASIRALIGFETAGSVTVTVEAGNEADYSDAITIGSAVVTATGSLTGDEVVAAWAATDVYRYWQLVLDAPDAVSVYEVELYAPVTFTGAHGDLSGRDVADQHPADAVTYDNATSGLTAADVQAAIDEIVAGGLGGFETYDEGGNPLSQDHGSMGATETIDAADGNHHTGTLDASCTITVAAFNAGSIVFVVTQDGTGGWDITWSGVTFGGADDQPDQTAGNVTVYTFLSSGGTVYGFKAGGGASVDAPTISALGFVGSILISDSPSTPLVFADLVQNEDQNDLVYEDL